MYPGPQTTAGVSAAWREAEAVVAVKTAVVPSTVAMTAPAVLFVILKFFISEGVKRRFVRGAIL
ncbi:hypothetical protein GCM10010176_056500 [Nonomuraea spiralis]|nr:hypothetical protein GCM10010176_056500 [Nonomuraea spiralis]